MENTPQNDQPQVAMYQQLNQIEQTPDEQDTFLSSISKSIWDD